MTKVAVIGGGVAGLTAAWELVRAGVAVELYEAQSTLGGAVSPLRLGGIELDAGAEAFATRSSAVRDLITELGLAEQIVSPNPAGAWLQLPGLAAPLPSTGVLGIPGEPQAQDVVRILGTEGAARAAADLRAPMTWTAERIRAQEPSLGQVVRDRMGEAVVDKLVSPITSGVHSAAPDDLALRAAHPKLGEALVEQGSLARAVAALRSGAPAGSAVQSLRGGMHTLVARLHTQLKQAGATIRLQTEIRDLQKLQTEHIVLAVDEHRAAALAGPHLPAVLPAARGAFSGVALVTLLVRAHELDAFPRGTGMLVAPTVEHIGAKAMTHISAKWEWAGHLVRQQLGPGHHLLRLSYGRITDAPGPGTLGFHSGDQDLLDAAERDLPSLTGAAVAPRQLLDAAVVRWQQALPGTSAAQRGRAEEFRSALAAARASGSVKLWAVGAWASGTGLSQVIPDARQAAREILAQA